MIGVTANSATLTETPAELADILLCSFETTPPPASHFQTRFRLRSNQPTVHGFACARSRFWPKSTIDKHRKWTTTDCPKPQQ